MKVGDTVKIITNPSMEWMKNYLAQTFEVQDIDSTSLKLKMVGSDPEWVWSVSKDNFEVVSEIPSR